MVTTREKPPYLVYGLGVSGKAVATYLQQNHLPFYVWDDNPETHQHWPVYNKTQPINTIILSPGIAIHKTPLLQKLQPHTHIICDIELFLHSFPSQPRAIGVTGTNGKSTTTALIDHMLSHLNIPHACGGNIGIPAFDLPQNMAQDFYYLWELSSFQLDLMPASQLEYALLLNIAPDHLDHHPSLAAYIKAKTHIFECLAPQGIGFIGIDDAYCDNIYQTKQIQQRNIIPISHKHKLKDGIYIENGIMHSCFRESSIDLTEVSPLKGTHNFTNVAFALSLCDALGVPHEDSLNALAGFSHLEHRMEVLGTYQNVCFVNDSKATNCHAAKQSLATFSNIYWIAGGIFKEPDLHELTPYLTQIKMGFLIGDSAPLFAQFLTKHNIPFVLCDTLDKAFMCAFQAAKEVANYNTAHIVLAPACASFDQYKNYAARGTHFKHLYQELSLR